MSSTLESIRGRWVEVIVEEAGPAIGEHTLLAQLRRPSPSSWLPLLPWLASPYFALILHRFGQLFV